MNWNDYEAVWKRQELPVGAAADVASLKQTFETKHRKMAATLLVRDFTEAGAGVVGVAVYAWFWWQMGRSGWPMAFAMTLILGVAGFFVRERLRARRNRLSPDAPMLAKVESDLAELRRQCRLLRFVWLWYLGPCAGAMAIQMAVIYRRAQPWNPVREPLVLLGFGAFLVVLLGFAWWLNDRAVRKQVEPRLAELEKLHRDLVDG